MRGKFGVESGSVPFSDNCGQKPNEKLHLEVLVSILIENGNTGLQSEIKMFLCCIYSQKSAWRVAGRRKRTLWPEWELFSICLGSRYQECPLNLIILLRKTSESAVDDSNSYSKKFETKEVSILSRRIMGSDSWYMKRVVKNEWGEKALKQSRCASEGVRVVLWRRAWLQLDYQSNGSMNWSPQPLQNV